MHQDATGYLREWISKEGTPSWLKELVSLVLSNQNTLSEDEVGKICDTLLAELKLRPVSPATEKQSTEPKVSSPEAESKEETADDNIRLVSLSDVKGVNLLKDDQILEFSPFITIVYGHNGSGKTGYFRVLNRISERTAEKGDDEIIGNIFAEDKTDLQAAVKYKKGETDFSESWEGQKGFSHLKSLEVFDSAFARAHLSKKDNEFYVAPFRTALIQMVGSAIIGVQSTLEEKIQDKVAVLETCKTDILSSVSDGGEVHDFISGLDSISDEDREAKASKLMKWTVVDAQSLAVKNNERRKVISQSSEVGKKSIMINSSDLSALHSSLEGIFKQFTLPATTKVKTSINAALDARKIAQDESQKLEVLKNIPNSDSKEWKDFLLAGENYLNKAALRPYPVSESDCIYCGQKLDDLTSQKRIEAFQTWLSSKANDELDVAESTLSTVSNEYDSPIELSLPEDQLERLKVLLGAEVYKNVEDFVSASEGKRKDIVNTITSSKWDDEFKAPNEGVITTVKEAYDAAQKLVDNFDSLQKTAKDEELVLDKEIEDLSDRKTFVTLKESYLQCLYVMNWIRSAKSVNFTSVKAACSSLRTAADRELIGDTFSARFKEEREKLRVRVDVKVSMHTSDTSSERRKSIGNWGGDIADILSEGERNAIATADFFTELSLKKGSYPIVFDDPVSSYDDERIELVAKRLVSEARGGRQIIVFTHSRSFCFALINELHINPRTGAVRDYMSKGCTFCIDDSSKNNCKSEERCYNYRLIKQSVSDVGIIESVIATENTQSLLDEARGLVDSNKMQEACGKIRRSIEAFIDEIVLARLRSKYWPERHFIEWEQTTKVRPLSDDELRLIREVHDFACSDIHLSESGGTQPDPAVHERIDKVEELYKNYKGTEMKAVVETKVDQVKAAK